MSKDATETQEQPKRKKKGFRPLNEQEKKWRNVGIIFFITFLLLFVGQLIVYLIFGNYNDWLYALVIQIVLLMPAYLADVGMPIVGGGPPLDRGHICKDGRRLFGKGKTIRGFFLGPLLFGIPISLLIHYALFMNWGFLEPAILGWFGEEGTYIIFDQEPEQALRLFKIYLLGDVYNDYWLNFPKLFARVSFASFGTAIGDLVGSWAKRRMDRQRGEPIWGLDQLDFTVFVFLFTIPFVPLDMNFLVIVIYTFIFTPSLTLFANWIGYAIGLKEVPW